MKFRLLIVVVLIISLAALSFAQDNKAPMDERFKRIQAHWAWHIINTLNLDMDTEKGRQVLDVLNKKGRAEHEYYYFSRQKRIKLVQTLREGKYDKKQIEAMIMELEADKLKFHEDQIAALKEIEKLLTPLERALLMKAEDDFRQKVRNAMRGGRNRGRGNGGGRGRDDTPPMPPNER